MDITYATKGVGKRDRLYSPRGVSYIPNHKGVVYEERFSIFVI